MKLRELSAKKKLIDIPKDFTRCSLLQMTPRDSVADFENGGFESSRSTTNQQLTGIKPKALEFVSPMKSPAVRNMASASTQERTASAGPFGHGKEVLQQTFGLSNCVFKCEQNDSPEIEGYPEDRVDQKDISLKLKNIS